MAKCISCGKELNESQQIKIGNNFFCNNLCRVLFEFEKKDLKQPQINQSAKLKPPEKTKEHTDLIFISSPNAGKSKLWKIHFIILAIISVPVNFSQGFHSRWEIYDCLYFVGMMIGYFGFCWNKRIGNEWFWKTYFWVSIAWNLLSPFVNPLSPQELAIFKNNEYSAIIIPIAILFLALFLPLIIGLYKYSYKQSPLWAKNISGSYVDKREVKTSNSKSIFDNSFLKLVLAILTALLIYRGISNYIEYKQTEADLKDLDKFMSQIDKNMNKFIKK